MYEDFVEAAKKYLFFRPMTVGDHDILIAGSLNKFGKMEPRHNPNLEHLTCFTGGMLAIACKILTDRRTSKMEENSGMGVFGLTGIPSPGSCPKLSL
jgi:hypothetical protein